MVMEGIQEDMGEGNMVCTNHPYKNSTPGGICAFCLQEKLGKLVSSSFPSATFPSSSSSSTPSFRSDFGGPTNIIGSSSSTTSTTSTLPVKKGNEYQFESIRKSRMPFVVLTQRRKKKNNGGVSGSESTPAVFKRSKSTATPRTRVNFLEVGGNGGEYSFHKRGFWSFLYLSSKKSGKDSTFEESSSSSVNGSMRATSTSRDKKREEKREESSVVVVEENDNDQSSFDRKVSRSRSVGCGSRSFSGDFFERISTGFGDCTLRRVESQREGKTKVGSSGASGQDCIKERVRCGGIFSGFMITSSSSSSSSSSYWVSSEENGNGNGNGKASMASVGHNQQQQQLAHGRSRSWGWAFASPMRAFTKPSSVKREASSNKNTTPNLAAIPSLLTARG